MELLRKFSPRGLEYQEIDRYLNVGKSLYTVLDRLEDRQLITKRRSQTNTRRWVYCLPDYTTNEDNTTIVNCELVIDNCFDTPPLTSFSSGVELLSENLTGKEVEVSQQLFNIDSTTIQHPPIVRFNKNTHNQDGEINSEAQNFIQHTTRDEGERGCVEQSQLDDVLQISRSVHSTTTTEDTAYQTNSQNPSSQQKAFQQKYQPVEVRNSEGEWVNGYYSGFQLNRLK